jgi:hypothetical protein
MKYARPLLAIAVSTVLAAPTPSARAEEPRAMPARFGHASVQPTWEVRPADHEPRREAGIALSVSPLAIEPDGASTMGGGAEPGSGLADQLEYSLSGLMLAATSVPLVLIGVPLWAASEGAELGPTEVELGLGLSSLALRGSF